MFKCILAISLWIAVISFVTTVITFFYYILFEPTFQYSQYNALWRLGINTMCAFVVSIIAAAAVVIFSQKTKKQD